MTGKELGKFLYDNGVYDTYQFIQNTRKTITTACFCKDTILSLINGWRMNTSLGKRICLWCLISRRIP